MGKWRRFWKLSPDQRGTVVRAAMLFVFTEAGLRVMGFQRCKEFIERQILPSPSGQNMESAARFDAAERITRAVRSAELHGPVKPNCLERSMVLWCLLRRAGLDGELHIGARKKGLDLEAHAWVELDGHVLNDSPDVHKHYARFDAPIAAAQEN